MLAARGHDVRVLTSGRRKHETIDGVAVTRLDVSDRGMTAMAVFTAWLNAAVVGRAHWAQVVHVQQTLPPAATLALTARLLRKPIVVTNHGSGIGGGMQVLRALPFGRLAVRALRNAACVALTESMATEMRASGIEPRATIPNGVEVRPPSSASRERNALFVGRLDPIKGLETLARAALMLRDVRVDVVGDGPLKDRLGPPLRLHGATADVSPWLNRAGVFVMPSKSEGFGMALLEAMAHGCACVATDVDGSRALLGGGAGVLVPPGDAEALAREIQRLIDDPAAARELGQLARARAARSFSAAAMADAYERLYVSLLK